jgi:LmbE family N-acetylglucosaminyl deacetylase
MSSAPVKNRLPEHRCTLARLTERRISSLLVVGAHPDDESIGVGATMGSLAALGVRVRVLVVTDGAPLDAALREALRDRSPKEAADIRARELAGALRAGGLDPDLVLEPSLRDVRDQEAPLSMARIARDIAQRLERARFDVIVTHPYEGGHPDHDATAFAVHTAVRLRAMTTSEHTLPAIAEMTSYHDEGGTMATGRFLESRELACTLHHDGLLDDDARKRKRAMFAAFPTQSDLLAPFDTIAEPLRCAPIYDFTRPPHAGALHYERLPFGWTSVRWCELAKEAMRELGL